MSIKKINGFSLIELMVVVAIVGILAAIAVPSYQKYIEKAKFSEVISSSEPYKLAVSLDLQESIPIAELNSGEHDIPIFSEATENLENIVVNAGVITATATAALDESTYILTPNNTGTQWVVSGTCKENSLC
ncbi:MAG: prepilin-type N-terminal cleavage/methylation domain-containing protein [Pseudomonadota bacterium]